MKEDPAFIEHHKEDLAASLERTIVDILMKKLDLAVKQTGIRHVALSGEAFLERAKNKGWTVYIPRFAYTTDNAAMIAITGYFKYLDGDFCPIDKPAFSRTVLDC